MAERTIISALEDISKKIDSFSTTLREAVGITTTKIDNIRKIVNDTTKSSDDKVTEITAEVA